ncbi:AAA+ family ATPase [Pseudothioclava nitratireducens]|jgi:hypothetical protein|uniref:AAA+ family ATPase n=1 Tax=Pseudothioclava nitratireducens TaxID=1928646 RepID=UPI0023DC1906|nr:AAA+ family ATPase [Defluviimonas nitratireducens]MDF1620231.1 AAA+ family ATPase [Defluviimonas nitratireducens]
MKRIIAPSLIALSLAAPLAAQDRLEPPAGDVEEGMSLLERGIELILRGFMDEMEPTIDQMQKGLEGAAKELGPAIDQLIALFDDVRNYEAPERLPNGDIIIRRRPDAPPPAPLPGGPVPDENGQIEL